MKGLISVLDNFLKIALLVIGTSMLIVVLWQVVGRYALQAPSSVTEELARFLLIWLGMLGAVYTFRNRMHVCIDVFVTTLEQGERITAEVLAMLVSLVFAVVILIFGGFQLVELTRDLEQTSAALGIQMFQVYLVLPLSGILISIYAVNHIVNILWTNDRKGEEAAQSQKDPDEGQ